MSATASRVPVDLFRGSIFSAFAEVLSQVSGRPWKTEAAPVVTAKAEVEVGFQCQGTACGPFAFRMSVATGVRLAKLLTGEPVPESVGQLSGDDREALEELLRQVVGIAATRAERDFGKLELNFVGRSTAAPGDEQTSFSLTAEGETLYLEVCVGRELLGSLRPARESTGTELTASQAVPPAAASVGALTQAAIREGNLELLWDVALSLTLRFGQRELLLKEILELSPGAVIELDRQVDEPVDLLLERKVIARGEIVIVDGNYGLRITEVASAAEKLACLP
jgi:flagellar motor switch protein FliN/FliY